LENEVCSNNEQTLNRAWYTRTLLKIKPQIESTLRLPWDGLPFVRYLTGLAEASET